MVRSRKCLGKQMSLMVFRLGIPFGGTHAVRDTLVCIVAAAQLQQGVFLCFNSIEFCPGLGNYLGTQGGFP